MAQRNTWTHQRQKRREQKKYEKQQVMEENSSCQMAVSIKKEENTVSTDTGSSSKASGSVGPHSHTSAFQSQSQIDIKSVKRKGGDDLEYENSNKRQKGGQQDSLQKADDLLDCAGKTYESKFPNEGSPQLSGQSELYSYCVKPTSTKKSQNLEINESTNNSFGENVNDKKNTEFVQVSVGKNEECHLISPYSMQKRHDQIETKTDCCILKAVVSVSKVGPEIHIEMAWLEGTCGRDAVHQVMQYIKNNLKI